MNQPWDRPDLVSTPFIFFAMLFGLIAMPFVKCGEALGCVEERVHFREKYPGCLHPTEELCASWHKRQLRDAREREVEWEAR